MPTRYDSSIAEFRRRVAFARTAREGEKAYRVLRMAIKLAKVSERGSK